MQLLPQRAKSLLASATLNEHTKLELVESLDLEKGTEREMRADIKGMSKIHRAENKMGVAGGSREKAEIYSGCLKEIRESGLSAQQQVRVSLSSGVPLNTTQL